MYLLNWRSTSLRLLLLTVAAGFSFNVSTPTQCGQLTLLWDGGTGPFHFILVPTTTVNNGRILNITIPSDITGPPYSHTFQLSAPTSLKFLASMWDSTGWGAGGTTSELTVGSGSDSSCLQPALLYDFYFSTSTSSPNQCSNLEVTWPSNVSLPVNLYGMIPHGTSFPITIPQSSSNTSVNWPVDIAQNTQFLLLMSDTGPYQTGGSTSLMTVGGGDSGCLNANSPGYASASATGTGTASDPSSIVDGVGGGSSGGTSNNSGGDNNTSTSSKTGAIVGGAVGGVAFLVLLSILLFCCIRRRSSSSPLKSYGISSEKRHTNTMDILGRGRQNTDEEELAAGAAGAGRRAGHTEMNGGEYEPSPFRYPSPPPVDGGNNTFGHGAGAIGAALDRRDPIPPSSFQALGVGGAEKQESARQSIESGRTGTTTPGTGTPGTGTGTATTPGMTTTVGSSLPASSLAGQSDHATLGHTGGVIRNASTRKPVPSTPVASGMGEGAGDRPSPLGSTGISSGEPRLSGDTRPTFVQHEDAGEVVDLPPRYDQLRARNPDVTS